MYLRAGLPVWALAAAAVSTDLPWKHVMETISPQAQAEACGYAACPEALIRDGRSVDAAFSYHPSGVCRRRL
jgi:hypothetical protein